MREQYLKKRQELMNKAQSMIDAGNIEEFNKITAEIERLDNDYDAKAQAQANLNALNDTKIKGISENFTGKGEFNMELGTKSAAIDCYDTNEYRQAFMSYVITGEKTSVMTNANENTKTTDVGSVIPTTVLNKIIEKIEAASVILPLVTRTSYKGGLTIPTSNVKPKAVWVAEGQGSDRQKKTTGQITFAYHKLRCAISVSLETDVMALSAFEATFINNVSEAMAEALEISVIKGTGSGQPKGILAETPVDDQKIQIEAGTALSYKLLTQLEAALPSQYESGTKYVMSKKTFMEFMSITDTAGQPVARTNYGIAGKPERSLLGRDVLISENVDSISAAPENDTIVAFMFRMSDYILNTNLNMTVKEYEDNETDDKVRKAIMLVDGKVVDKNSLVELVIKKKTD